MATVYIYFARSIDGNKDMGKELHCMVARAFADFSEIGKTLRNNSFSLRIKIRSYNSYGLPHSSVVQPREEKMMS